MTTTAQAKPMEMQRFTMQVRQVVGYSTYYRTLQQMHEEAVYAAIYAPDPEKRSVAAGRAQALRESIDLLIPPL